jgi:glyoxylase-like metal-dependent hydrolase (beta-lactamase superfamily II)
MSETGKFSTITQAEMDGVTRYSCGNLRIYKMPVQNFPHHFTNVYLVLDKTATLVDVGYSGANSSACLEQGFHTVATEFGEHITIEDVENIIITHGHGDHFGLLCYEKLKRKKVYVHPLDSYVLTNHREAYASWVQNQLRLIREAGARIVVDNPYANPDWSIAPEDYTLIPVSDEEEIINGYKVHHFPGHSLGHICIGVGPFLFLGDHMLSSTTPHQAPRRGWRGAGLETYLLSLRKTATTGYQLGLPAHEDTIHSIPARAQEIEVFHYQRLTELLQICEQEKNLDEITMEYYSRHPEFIEGEFDKEFSGSNKVLALEEIKAHLEYLAEKGMVLIKGNEVPRYQSKRIGAG